jgi:NTP pyrophosphatase (non-canonical NTP hydrolase)
MLNELAKEVHQNAKSKGFYDKEKNIGEMLCLVHSEVSEALEADRKNLYTTGTIETINSFVIDEMFVTDFKIGVKDTFEDELADIMIRVMDLAAFKGINLEEHIKAKMRYNSLREHKHGKAY